MPTKTELLTVGLGTLAVAGGIYWLVTREVEAEEPEVPEEVGGTAEFVVTIG